MAQIQRTAEAAWHGDSRSGGGTFTTGSGAIRELNYTWKMRFEDETGTNPEELIVAAIASCFTMALASRLGRAGFTPESLNTHAVLTMEQVDGAWTITTIRLEVEGKVPNIDAAAFRQNAEEAKNTCPISRLLTPGLKGMEVQARLK